MVLHALLVLIFFAHLVRSRISPASVYAWFLLVLLAPYIGFLIYAIFGSRKFRVTNRAQILDSAEQRQLPEPLQRLLVASGCPPPTTAQSLQVLHSGETAYSALVQQIQRASRSIDIETYIFSSDSVGVLLLSELIRALHRGVKVRILLDDVGAHLPGHPHFKNFQDAGGEVLFFMPLLHLPFRGQSNLRNHRKLIVFDQSTALMGGMNLAKEYMGPHPDPKRWLDLAFLLTGPTVIELQSSFDQDWLLAQQKKFLPPSTPTSWTASHSSPNGASHLMQVVPSGPHLEVDTIYDFILAACYRSETRIWIATPYFVPDENLLKALEIASRRGVDVRLMIPKYSNHKIADMARGVSLERLLKVGAGVFYYPIMTHAKALVFDDSYAFVGSANFDGRSLILNYEIGLCFYSTDDVQMMSQWFEAVLPQCELEGPERHWYDPWAGALVRLSGSLV